jgi:hypothetical protein
MNFEEVLARQEPEHVLKSDRKAWLRATRLRHAALAMVAIDVAEAMREIKEEITELRAGGGNSPQ